MKTLISFAFTLLFVNGFAQDYRFGKVSKDELSKTRSTIDPESPAEILYEKTNIVLDFNLSGNGFTLTTEVEGRIKIYDKANTDDDYLKKEVLLYVPNSTRDKISGFRGVTYNLVNGKIEETKIKGNEIFNEKLNKYWEVEKFAFSNVKDGSVLEYKYTIISPYFREIKRRYFQEDIPVVYSEYKFSHPDFFMYSQDFRGEVRGKNNTSTKPVPDRRYSTKVNEYIFENVKPLKNEPFVINPNNLKASVRYELMMFSYPGMISENYSATWQQIAKDLNNSDDLGKQLSGNGFLDETVQSLTANASDQLEKTQIIFNFVKNNFTWNGFRSKYAENGIRKTFKDKTGNVADINLLLISMLQKAGINANPVVLSTVDNLMINYTFPSMTGLNYLIAVAEINQQLYLMDATEKMSKINMLPLRDLNHRGFRILSNGNMQEISLTNNSMSSVKEMIGVTLNVDGTVSGNYIETKDEYFAMVDNKWRNENPKDFERDYISDFSFDVGALKIDENAEKGMVRYTLKFENAPGGEVIGNKILINPLLFTQLSKSSFQYESRSYPLEFGTMLTESRMVKIKIPEGYKVESLPQEKQFAIEGGLAAYVYKVIEKDGYVEATTVFQVNKSILPPGYYKPMKELQNQQINAESQQVVLIKL